MPQLLNPETGEIISFHSELTADWEDSVEVTSNPVPFGEPSTNHKEKKPRTYSLKLVQTDTPLAEQVAEGAEPPGSRWDSVVERFLDRNLMERLSYVSTTLGLVTDLDITSVRRGRNKELRTIYEIQLTKARYARAQAVTLPPAKRQKKPTTTPEVDKGPQPTTEAPTPLQSANHRIYVQGGSVRAKADSIRERLKTQTYAVGDQSAAPPPPSADELFSSYMPAGPQVSTLQR